MRWQIITGEYPPQLGGISDYTRQTARGLAAAGDQADVWTPPAAGEPPADPGVRVHRLPDHFGRASLAALDRAMGALPAADRRLLVQYEPWSFGWRGMNVPFCFWLWHRSGAWDITVMFHETCADCGWRLGFKRNVLGAISHLMLGFAVRAARRAFVSIPAWTVVLRPWAGRRKKIVCLPVPSSLPGLPEPAAVDALRHELLGQMSARQLVGHFGTYCGEVGALLRALLPAVLGHGAGVLLVGRGAAEFARTINDGRVLAADSLPLEDVARHLAACDVLVQPYPDGVSARRTSTMAGLSLGAAVVTNAGELSEPFWAACGAVRLVSEPSAPALAAAVLGLLDDPGAQAGLRAAALAYYRDHFSAARVIAALRQERSP